ncbi:MAG TPA: type IX secretion system membrane protein PorP/SprF [Cyclobacteriaceae bacterium]|nr:type IX secretion system membrane protein PorP/SprF [Cyclobacteriaceae bacterium]
MKTIKKNLILGLVTGASFLICTGAYSQQHPIFTQYMFNGLVLNPAYSGSHESATLTASYRKQWTGINGAPQTTVFSGHSPIKFTRSAAGLVAMNDRLGVTNQYMIYGTYAYRIPLSENAKLSVGGQAGVTYYKMNLTDLDVVTSTGQADPAFAKNEGRFLPNLGIGIYYYSKKSYVGLSLPTIINNKFNNQDALMKARQERHYFLSAGHVFDLSPDLKLKPNVLLKWVENGPFQYDINANLFIKSILWVGVSYRMQDSVDGLLEWLVNDQLSFGYSYGYPTNALTSLQSGTHEIVLNYRIKRNKNIILSPRYF